MAILSFLRQTPGVLLVLAVFVAANARAAVPQEAQIKAAYLLHFARFAEWPSEAWGTEKNAFVIGVLGDDPFGRYLDEVVAGEMIDQRPMIVRRFERAEEITPCHMLYIAASESRRLGQIMALVARRPILTVGETEGFWREGGMIRFVTVQNRVRFQINQTVAKRARLSLSSKLLRAAEHVE